MRAELLDGTLHNSVFRGHSSRVKHTFKEEAKEPNLRAETSLPSFFFFLSSLKIQPKTLSEKTAGESVGGLG